MARIIRIDETKEKEMTHEKCGAVIGYYEREVVYKNFPDYGGGNDTYGHITCPHCHDVIQFLR